MTRQAGGHRPEWDRPPAPPCLFERVTGALFLWEAEVTPPGLDELLEDLAGAAERSSGWDAQVVAALTAAARAIAASNPIRARLELESISA